MKTKIYFVKVISVAAMVVLGLPGIANSAQVAPRSLTLGNSQAGVATTHTLAFTVPTGGNVGSIKFQYCTTAYGACAVPTGLVTTGASLSAQSGATGFTIVNGSNGSPYLTRSSSNINASTPVSYTLSGITNPTSANTEYWTRIYTYVSTDTTGASTDDGVVAWSTAQAITVSGVMPESLIFCVGTSGTNCGNMTGSTVDLGVFSPIATNTGTSIMSASTNASSGYVITITGTVPTSGLNTIAAMGTQVANSSGCSPSCSSSIGVPQFGTNVVDNATPNVGAGVTGTGSGVGIGGYNVADSFRFFNGDTVASAGGVTQSNLYTNSYVVNVGGDQAAGTYTATMTYICTATF
jgi:hypothetical protein